METSIKIDVRFWVVSFLLYVCFITAGISYAVPFLLTALAFFWFLKTKKFEWLLYFLVLLIFWQNLWIAFASGRIEDKYAFNVLHGINFLLPLSIFLLLVVSIRNLPREFVTLWFATLLVGTLLMVATAIGGFLYGLQNAITYFRLFFGPLILFWVGFWLSHHPTRHLRRVLRIILFASLGISVLQFVFPRPLTILLNDVEYFNLKIGVQSVDEVLQYLRETTYFNLPIDLQIPRVSGVVKSFISNAYFLIILSIILYWKKSKLFCWVVAIIVSVCSASKGAILLFLFFNLFAWMRQYFSYGILILTFSTLWALVVFAGYKASNEHIIGFIAGAKYLFTPGNGLGFSGNLSTVRLTAWNGVPLPDLGYWTRFQNGSESTFGVLFSSLGIFSLLFIIFNANLITAIIRKGKQYGFEHLGFLSLLVFMQGIFQEEAFSPFVLGLVLFVSGYVISGKKSIDHD